MIHTLQFDQLKERLAQWKEKGADNLLEGMWEFELIAVDNVGADSDPYAFSIEVIVPEIILSYKLESTASPYKYMLDMSETVAEEGPQFLIEVVRDGISIFNQITNEAHLSIVGKKENEKADLRESNSFNPLRIYSDCKKGAVAIIQQANSTLPILLSYQWTACLTTSLIVV